MWFISISVFLSNSFFYFVGSFAFWALDEDFDEWVRLMESFSYFPLYAFYELWLYLGGNPYPDTTAIEVFAQLYVCFVVFAAHNIYLLFYDFYHTRGKNWNLRHKISAVLYIDFFSLWIFFEVLRYLY